MQPYDTLKASDNTGNAVLAHVTLNRLTGSTVLKVDSVSKWNTLSFIATSGTLGSDGYLVPASVREFVGHITAGDIIIDSWEPGFTDTGHTAGQVVVIKQTTGWANRIATGLNSLTQSSVPAGSIMPFAGKVAPSADWLMTFGQAVSRSTYATLFNLLNPVVGVFTITIAAPGVATLAAHGLNTGDPVYFTTTGALPTGLTINTVYYAIRIDANTFRLATTYANAVAGTAITTTGSQSGVHTVRNTPYGLGDGTTTFNVPDLRGRAIAGKDDMGGTSANRLTNPATTTGGLDGDILGNAGGAETHQLTTAQLASHSHPVAYGGAVAVNNGSQVGVRVDGANNTSNSGSDVPHNNVQPTLVLNYIIKV